MNSKNNFFNLSVLVELPRNLGFGFSTQSAESRRRHGRRGTHLAGVGELVAAHLALVGAHDVGQVVLGQELVGDVRPEVRARAAQAVRYAAVRGLRVTPQQVEHLRMRSRRNMKQAAAGCASQKARQNRIKPCGGRGSGAGIKAPRPALRLCDSAIPARSLPTPKNKNKNKRKTSEGLTASAPFFPRISACEVRTPAPQPCAAGVPIRLFAGARRSKQLGARACIESTATSQRTHAACDDRLQGRHGSVTE